MQRHSCVVLPTYGPCDSGHKYDDTPLLMIACSTRQFGVERVLYRTGQQLAFFFKVMSRHLFFSDWPYFQISNTLALKIP